MTTVRSTALVNIYKYKTYNSTKRLYEHTVCRNKGRREKRKNESKHEKRKKKLILKGKTIIE
jgi:hypothetical protein